MIKKVNITIGYEECKRSEAIGKHGFFDVGFMTSESIPEEWAKYLESTWMKLAGGGGEYRRIKCRTLRIDILGCKLQNVESNTLLMQELRKYIENTNLWYNKHIATQEDQQ